MKINIKRLIKEIVSDTISVMKEEHDRGEWWIDNRGHIIYCDNNVGDQGHEGVVIQAVVSEILSHFNINVDDPETLDSYEEFIKDILVKDGRLNDKELAGWNNMPGASYAGPVEVIAKKLLEDKVFTNNKQALDAVFIAYGSSKDARDYAMEYWGWKIMKATGRTIEIQTWHLKPNDLQLIVKGIYDIMQEHDDSDELDLDNKLGDDGLPGPRVNVTVQASGKRFSNIPLSILEKLLPQKIQAYRSGVHVGYTETINEEKSYHYNHKDYRLYEGNRHIVAIFEDNSRLAFEVHFRNVRGADKEKWRRKAFSTWKSVANEIRRDSTQLNEVGNQIQKSWKDCFKEALEDPKLKEYIRKNKHQSVYSNNSNSIIDPINFSFR